jgi:hypothetical protein
MTPKDEAFEAMRRVIRDAIPAVCESVCPSKWVTAEGQPHSDLCKALRAALPDPAEFPTMES